MKSYEQLFIKFEEKTQTSIFNTSLIFHIALAIIVSAVKTKEIKV